MDNDILLLSQAEIGAGAKSAYRAGEAKAYLHAAAMARNCSHTCMTEKHCDFLHAAHERLAKELETLADNIRAGSQ